MLRMGASLGDSKTTTINIYHQLVVARATGDNTVTRQSTVLYYLVLLGRVVTCNTCWRFRPEEARSSLSRSE